MKRRRVSEEVNDDNEFDIETTLIEAVLPVLSPPNDTTQNALRYYFEMEKFIMCHGPLMIPLRSVLGIAESLG